MVRTRRIIPALGAVLFAVIGLAACGGGIPGNAVVQVGNTSITKAQFDHWLGIAAAATAGAVGGAKPAVPLPPDYTACVAQKRATAPKPANGQTAPTDAQFKAQCATEYAQLRDEVLQYLVSAQWVLGEAADQKVSVTDAEVQKEFNTEKSQQFTTNAAYQQFLASSGQTAQDILFKVRLNLLSQKIQAKVTKASSTITPAQVQQYYNSNKSRFGTPESRDLRLIRVNTPAQAQTVISTLNSGQPFAAVAKKYSVDTSKAQGGVVSGIVRGEEVTQLDNAIFGANKGALVGPVKTAYGYYIFRVQKITPGTSESFAQVQNSIKQQLAAQNEQTSLTRFLASYRKKWISRTNCRSGFVIVICSSYKAPKGATTTATPTPTPAG